MTFKPQEANDEMNWADYVDALNAQRYRALFQPWTAPVQRKQFRSVNETAMAKRSAVRTDDAAQEAG